MSNVYCKFPSCSKKAKKRILTTSGKSTDLCNKHVETAKQEQYFVSATKEYR